MGSVKHQMLADLEDEERKKEEECLRCGEAYNSEEFQNGYCDYCDYIHQKDD